VRRWTLLLAGAALWLFLAAIPALADGGPHVSSANSGSSALTADGCAGCHRAHTGNGEAMLVADSEEALCLSCHASAGVGASTDVEIGVQFRIALPVGSPAQDASSATAVLGALRGGGFVSARINSGNATRAGYATSATAPYSTPIDPGKTWSAKIGVRSSGQPVTSAHLEVGGSGVTLKGIAWGSASSGDAPALSLSCASCHNPHGNNQYRILVPVPTKASGESTAFVAANLLATTSVTDDTANTSIVSSDGGTDIRNYTVIQAKSTGGRYLLVSEITAGVSSTSGDYWHKAVPWDVYISSSSTRSSWDAPNGSLAAGTATESAAFNYQMGLWCTQCHSRYHSSTVVAAGDPYFDKHSTARNRTCTTCHVAHGSNAQMGGEFSGALPYPAPFAAQTSDSSRLLKVDNRGTCQLCHDPTKTVKVYGPNIGQNGNPWTGPTPAPGP